MKIKGMQSEVFLFIGLLIIVVLLIVAFYLGLYDVVKEFLEKRIDSK